MKKLKIFKNFLKEEIDNYNIDEFLEWYEEHQIYGYHFKKIDSLTVEINTIFSNPNKIKNDMHDLTDIHNKSYPKKPIRYNESEWTISCDFDEIENNEKDIDFEDFIEEDFFWHQLDYDYKPEKKYLERLQSKLKELEIYEQDCYYRTKPLYGVFDKFLNLIIVMCKNIIKIFEIKELNKDRKIEITKKYYIEIYNRIVNDIEKLPSISSFHIDQIRKIYKFINNYSDYFDMEKRKIKI